MTQNKIKNKQKVIFWVGEVIILIASLYLAPYVYSIPGKILTLFISDGGNLFIALLIFAYPASFFIVAAALSTIWYYIIFSTFKFTE